MGWRFWRNWRFWQNVNDIVTPDVYPQKQQKMRQQSPQRITIFSDDIERLTGKSARTAMRILQQIRQHYGKEKNEILTLAEFCEYTGLTEEEVRPFMSD